MKRILVGRRVVEFRSSQSARIMNETDCPKCGFRLAAPAPYCPKCGVIFAKWPLEIREPAPKPISITSSGRSPLWAAIPGVLASGLGGAAMFLWMFLNGMSHSGLRFWPLWYGAEAALLAGSVLFITAGGVARQRVPRHRGWEMIYYVAGAISGNIGLWGLAMRMAG